MAKDKTYAEKLRDPRWQKLRLQVFESDKWTCQHCGDKETELQVHHIVYHGEPWEADPTSLITLCKHCHQVQETFKPHDSILVVRNFKDKHQDTVIVGSVTLIGNTYAVCFFEFRGDAKPDQPYFIVEHLYMEISNYIKEARENGKEND